MLIVSLSSIPPRFDKIGPTLESLLSQTRPPDRIELWLPRRYHRFPSWDGTLPDLPAGVRFRRAESDLGPATKVLPAALAYRGADAKILFCDDDGVYPRDWAERFLAESARVAGAAIAISGYEAEAVAPATMQRKHQPRAVRRWRITDWRFQVRLALHRARVRLAGRPSPEPPRAPIKRAGYVDIFEGVAGVLVRPDWFDNDAFTIPALARGVDDVWLSGMLARRGIPVWLMGNRREQVQHDADLAEPLRRAVLDGRDRQAQNRACLDYLRDRYGIWP